MSGQRLKEHLSARTWVGEIKVYHSFWIYLSRIFRSDPQPLSSSSCLCSLSSCFFSLSSTSLSFAAVSTGLAAPKIDDALPLEVGAGAEELLVPPLLPPLPPPLPPPPPPPLLLLLSSSLGTLRGLRFNFGLCWGAAARTDKDKTKINSCTLRIIFELLSIIKYLSNAHLSLLAYHHAFHIGRHGHCNDRGHRNDPDPHNDPRCPESRHNHGGSHYQMPDDHLHHENQNLDVWRKIEWSKTKVED